MKKLFSVAILAAAFTFASCGNKPADTAAATTTTTPAATNTTPTPAPAPAPAVEDNTLSGRATKAICSCDAMKEMVSLSKEMEASPDKAKELRPKLMELAPKLEACEGSLGAEVKKLTGDDLKNYRAELMEKVDKTCPENNIMRKK
jgi:hypothetical protein